MYSMSFSKNLKGGILATFQVESEKFNVWVTNSNTIKQILDLMDGKSNASIPNGLIVEGSGEENCNAPWNWHYDPENIKMAEFTTEICDGLPSYVNANIDEWIKSVGRFCPWRAKLLDVKDYRR